MLRSYLKIAWRNLTRERSYSIINIVGLSVGLTCCLVIFLYVQEELSYDQFHDHAERIYRVVQEEVDGDGLAWSGPQMGLRMARDFPQIEALIRIIDGAHGYGSSATISPQKDETGTNEHFEEEGFIYADPGFFSFFTFPLIKGSPETALAAPGTVVLAESTAQKYFGDNDPVGQTLLLDGGHTLEITGVATDPPANSHLDFNFVASYQTFYAKEGIAGEVDSFWWPPTHTYAKLPNEDVAESLRAELPSFFQRHRDTDDVERMALHLQPLTEIWLGPSYRGQQQAGGSMTYVYLFSAIALFILALACINFTNLATAQAADRAREVGIRKVAGATRRQLIGQFLTEALLLSLAAVLLALILANLTLPFFNGIAGRTLSIPYDSGAFWVTLLALVAAAGLLAGSYPAMYLSRFQPVQSIKGAAGRLVGGTGLRKGLVVFQFGISVVLLIGTTVMYQQLHYLQDVHLGFDKEHVVVLPGYGLGGLGENDESSAPLYETLQLELLQQAPVRAVTVSSSRPGIGTESTYVWEGEGLPDDPNRQFPVQFVGQGYFGMMDIEVVAGRALRAGDPADIGTVRRRIDQEFPSNIMEDRAIVINETAARQLGWSADEAIGKRLRFYITENRIIYQDYRGAVVGVVKDHHLSSLHEPIAPVAYMPAKTAHGSYVGLSHVLVKLAPDNAHGSMRMLEQTWNDVVSGQPFEANFLDESLASMYQSEEQLGRLIGAFALLAILIACLGLFGLASYAAERRRQEIGIRKVLGATVQSIMALLSKDFLILVLISFVLAAPLAYYTMQRWLEHFAYRVEIGPGIFALAGILAGSIALFTVSYQALRAAWMNPTEAIRNE